MSSPPSPSTSNVVHAHFPLLPPESPSPPRPSHPMFLANIPQEPRTRRSITIATKLEILDLLESGETIASVARFYDIDRKSVRSYQDNAEKLRNSKKSSSAKQVRSRLGGRGSPYPELDKRLVEYYQEEYMRGRAPTYKQLALKVEELRPSMNLPITFCGGLSWVSRWARRNQIDTCHTKGRRPSAASERRKEQRAAVGQPFEVVASTSTSQFTQGMWTDKHEESFDEIPVVIE